MPDTRQNSKITDHVADVIKDAISDTFKYVDWTDLIDIIANWFSPEEVFSKEDLSNWARDNGFQKVE